MQIFTHLTANDVQLQAFPFQRELSMEAYLIENEGILALDRDVFSDVEIVEAELTLKQGRKSRDTDGRIDILATYSQEYIAIIELKLGELNDLHLSQLEDYLKGRNCIRTQYPEILPIETVGSKWIGVLVGSSINASLASRITNGYQTADGIPIAALTIQRFRSKDGNIFIATDTYFKNTTSQRDYTRYKFNGMTLGKNRLVLEVVKDYVATHKNISYSELETVFPKRLQGSKGVFATVEIAQIQSEKGRRNFLKPEELIELSDCSIAVSTQWGITNTPSFIDEARKLGCTIESVNV
jgi:hypothetical protein